MDLFVFCCRSIATPFPPPFLYSNRLTSLLKGALSGLRQFLATESSLKMMKCFLFSLKSSLRSDDIYVFVLRFWSCSKTVS